MSENNYSQNGAEEAKIFEAYLTPDEFANRVGTQRQTISYHLRKGLLQRWVENGRILLDPYRIPEDMVEWFLSQNGVRSAQKFKSVGANISPVPFSSYAQMPQSNAQKDALMAKILENEEEIRRLSDTLHSIRVDSEQTIAALRRQVDDLRLALEQERIKNARFEERTGNLDKLFNEKERIITSLKQTIEGKDEAINSQKIAVDALNNERLVITQQLQKYRVPDESQVMPQKTVKWKWPWDKS